MINSKQRGVQNSGRWDPWLPVVESSRLFVQRTVRPPVCHEANPHAVDPMTLNLGGCTPLLMMWGVYHRAGCAGSPSVAQ